MIPRWGVASASAAPVLLIGGWTVAAALQPAGYDSVRDTISALAGHDASDRWVMTVALAGVGACHLATAAALRPAADPGRWTLAVGGVATALVAAFPLPAGGGDSAAHGLAAALAFGALAVWPALAARYRPAVHSRADTRPPPNGGTGRALASTGDAGSASAGAGPVPAGDVVDVGSASTGAGPVPAGGAGPLPAGGAGPVPIGGAVEVGSAGADRPVALRPVVAVAATAVLVGAVGWFAAELVAGTDRVGLAERVAAGAQALWPLAAVLTLRRSRSTSG